MSDYEFKSMGEVVSFLRSCILSGETLSAMDNAMIDKAIAADAAGYARGVAEAAKIATLFSIKPDRSLHPDVKREAMHENVQIAAHSTAQSIAMEINFLLDRARGDQPTQAAAPGEEWTTAYGKRISQWVRRAFGNDAMTSKEERTARVVEEAIELAQAEGLHSDFVRRVLDRVYSRPAGEPEQEAAGLTVCLLAWAESRRVDLRAVALTEIERIEQPEVTAKIQRKQAEKAAAGTGNAYPIPAEPPASTEAQTAPPSPTSSVVPVADHVSDAKELARELRHAEDRVDSGCSNCGGLPHTDTCRVWLAMTRAGYPSAGRYAPTEAQPPVPTPGQCRWCNNQWSAETSGQWRWSGHYWEHRCVGMPAQARLVTAPSEAQPTRVEAEKILCAVADILGLGGEQFFRGPVGPEAIVEVVRAEVARVEVLEKALTECALRLEYELDGHPRVRDLAVNAVIAARAALARPSDKERG